MPPATAWWATSPVTLAAVDRQDIRQRVFDYWRNIDKAIGDRIEAACLEKRKSGDEVKLLDELPPQPAPGRGEPTGLTYDRFTGMCVQPEWDSRTLFTVTA